MYEPVKDLNKEEGEISSDDDDVKIVRLECANSYDWRHWPRRGTKFPTPRKEKERNPSLAEHVSKKSRHTTKMYHKSRTSQDPRHVNPPSPTYNRPESPLFRSYDKRSEDREPWGIDYREYHDQRDYHQYDDHSQKSNYHTPNYGRLNDWRKKFYSSPRNVPSDGSFSRQSSEGLHRIQDTGAQSAYYRRSPDIEARYSWPSYTDNFRKREEMENDYNRLLQYYEQVQVELKMMERPSDSPRPNRSGDLAAGVETDTKSSRAEAESTPLMSITEVVSDVSSDEMIFSQDQQSESLSKESTCDQVSASETNQEKDCERNGVSSAVSVDEARDIILTSTYPAAEDQNEDEDLDILELRRLALESAALRKCRQHNESEDGATSITASSKDKTQGKCVKSKSVLDICIDVLDLTKDTFKNVSSQVMVSHHEKSESESSTQCESKSQTDKHPSLNCSRHSSESRHVSTSCAYSSEKESFRDDSRSSSEKTRTKSKEKENSESSCRKGKPRESSGKTRPLPFAPIRIETIRLKSLSSRFSSLTDAAKRVQRRARQTSVARQLPPKSSNTTSSSNSRKHASKLHKSPNSEQSNEKADRKKNIEHRRRETEALKNLEETHREADVEKSVEERSREMTRILSLTDQKEQVIRFLRLISYDTGTTAVATSSKTSSKLPTSTDNYEEVEMDIDSEDDLEDILRKNDIQITTPPVAAARSESAEDALMATAPWGASPLYVPTPLDLCSPHSVRFLVPPPLPFLSHIQLLPPLPPLEEPAPPPPPPPPPLPEDLPPPPPPPGVDETPLTTDGTDGSVCVNDEQRIYNMAQYFQRVVARHESIQRKTDHAIFPSSSEPPVLLSSDEPPVSETPLSPVAKRSSEDESSSLVSSSPSKPLVLTSSSQNLEEEAEEEDEMVMRERLLHAVLMRRKVVAEGKTGSTSSNESSPTPSGTASPHPPAYTKPLTTVTRTVLTAPKLPSYYKCMEFPVHKPVVVTLNNSSSEDEDEHETKETPVSTMDIDSFLKAQRKTAETLKQPTAAAAAAVIIPSPNPSDSHVVEMTREARQTQVQQQRILKLKETELSNLQRLLLSEELRLKAISSKFSNYLNEKKVADTKVAQLKKQLLVAERLALQQVNLVVSSREQVKQVKESIQKKKELVRTTMEEALTLGRKLMGQDYVLGSCPSPYAQDLKRKVQVTHSGPGVSFQPSDRKKKKLNHHHHHHHHQASGNGHSHPLKMGAHSSQDEGHSRYGQYAQLRQRAAALEQELQQARYQMQMQQFKKQDQLLVSVSAQDGKRCVVQNREKWPQPDERQQGSEQLPSLESIKLDPVEEEMATTKRSKRRSLLDMTQSSKPTLILGDHRQSSQDLGAQVKTSGAASGASTQDGKKGSALVEFKMPSGSQLSNLSRIQREKMEKVLTVPAHLPLKLLSNLSPSCSPIADLRVVLPGCRQKKQDTEAENSRFSYTSPLLQFRSYRFSPYYRTKESLTLTSATFSHKLNPNRVLCRYDMQGICNDQHCTWQHASDYKLSDREILMDLVSYCPSLADVNPDTPVSAYPTLIGDYVDQLLAQHRGKMTIDDLCLLLTARVNDAAGHVRPHTMFYECRPWHPCTSEFTTFSLSITSQFQTPSDKINGVPKSGRELDSVVDVDDVRYFTVAAADLEGSVGEVQDMEGAVLATPNNIHLWLRLAYSKLSSPARPNEECLSQALNVLSRGLESNKESTELWVHYLTLFRRHPDSDSEFEDMCETALVCAPCYDIWWMLLMSCVGFHTKDKVCNRAMDFLCERHLEQRKGEDSRDARFGKDLMLSHQMLEMLLYKVQLNIQTGRFKTALNFLKVVMGARESSGQEDQLMKALNHADSCVLWVCLAHLAEFQSLPSTLFDPANQGPGRIRSKERLLIPWHIRPNFLVTPLEPLVKFLAQAVTLDLDRPLDDCTSPQYVLAVHNLASLLCTQGKNKEVCHILSQILQSVPHVEDLWLMLADICMGTDDLDSARQVFETAVEANKYSAKIHYYYALVDMSSGNPDKALEELEQFVLGHYIISPQEYSSADPNQFFSKLLGLDLPLKKAPPLKEEVQTVTANRSIYLWLCYCLLLELQGEKGVVMDTYELALSSTTGAKDLCELWKSYVQFLHRQYHQAPAHSNQQALQHLQEAIIRSVATAPTLLPDPFPRQHQPPGQGQTWRDLNYVTSLVEFYLDLLPHDGLSPALHAFCDMMPDNVTLLIRCIEMAVQDGQIQRARSLCARGIYDKVANLHLWKLALALAQQDGTPREVEKLYVRAVTAMPLSVSLWKDFLLFEVSQENPMAVRTLLTHCQTLGLNIQGYVATIAGTC